METGRVVGTRSKAAIPVAWTFMSEILTKHGRMIEHLQGPITIASTVFHGQATDMNVHPAFDGCAIALKVVYSCSARVARRNSITMV